MLAIIRDLHLQETIFDCVCYRKGGTLKQIGVRRNVKAAAFLRLISRIEEAAERRKSEEIHPIFAGGIFKLHRAPTWFFGTHNHVRPTDPVGEDVPDNPLRRKATEILASRRTTRAMRSSGKRSGSSPTVKPLAPHPTCDCPLSPRQS